MENLKTEVWGIVTGCERLSPGCDSCPSYWEYYKDNRDYHPVFHNDLLNAPIENKIPTKYAVAFGSDLFHESIRIEQLEEVFEVMRVASWHHFLIATKRAERMFYSTLDLDWPDNCSVSVSIESSDFNWRIPYLRNCNAKTKIISAVPLIGDLGNINLKGIHLVCVQPETWGFKRECKQEWIDLIIEQCTEQGVEFSLEKTDLFQNGKVGKCPAQQ